YRPAQIEKRLDVILQEINLFFDYLSNDQPQAASDIQPLTRRRIVYLSAKRVFSKLISKLKK
ncbi:MAG: hypothetical protein WBA76_14395, partial [Phormidesmis sp.]